METRSEVTESARGHAGSAAYLTLLSRIVELGRQEGATIEAFTKDAPLRFAALPASSQDQVLASLARYVEVLDSVVASGISVLEDRQTLWAMMRRLKLRPASDLFANLEGEDVVEIYLVPEFVQVFRSFRFFFLCNYTLDDLLCRPWWDLYSRDEAITSRVMRTIEEALKKPSPQTTFYDVGPHTLVERDSSRRFRSIQELRFMSPLFDDDQHVGGIVNVVHPMKMLADAPNNELRLIEPSK